ncbi:DUF2630 family protein [Prauserella cavernicola]|uniref:DUF2630 family protein n=1 Tax=Prauserella cavernicola TaxID=2800127 RepID=A0A934QRG1_9PSEU|nr:DUF2630 family protein [Prauserella cavernicola]MBK1784088.1 DUF2630 family protein [Prauserella cavernicola]
MADESTIARIDALIAEERELRSHATGNGLDEDGKRRLTELELQLDQCWDLLRQRRARAEFGDDPDEATARSVRDVESYQQ